MRTSLNHHATEEDDQFFPLKTSRKAYNNFSPSKFCFIYCQILYQTYKKKTITLKTTKQKQD